MASTPHYVLVFGDQTDCVLDYVKQLYRESSSKPWLRSFLQDATAVIQDEIRNYDFVQRDSFGSFTDLLQLAERFRHEDDVHGLAYSLLVCVVRSAVLMRCAENEPGLFGAPGREVHILGLCGGLLNAATMVVAHDVSSLYQISLEIIVVTCRLSNVMYSRSRAVENTSGSWGWSVLGLDATHLQRVLDQFHDKRKIPLHKQAKIAVIGEGWNTVIGPPSVLQQFFSQCPMVKDMPKQKLKVRGLLHTTSLSESEVDFIVGTSTLLDLPVLPRFRVISPGGGAEYAHPTLGAMLRAVVRDMACRPLNMVETMTALNAKLGPVRYVELKLIGPTAQLPLVLQSLEAAGRNVTTRSVLEQQSSAQSGRIAVVGMAGRFPGCDDIEGYWEIISNGRAVHKEVRVPFIVHLVTCDGPSVSAPNMSASQIPPDRFDLADFFHPTHKGKNTAAVKHGCFIDKPGLFDARFFNISPREALQMEPTHRLFLMVTYEALEMAGYSQSRTKATDPSRIGVFFGQSTDDWQDIAHNRGSETFSLTGQQRAFGPARVSYHFKWDGPSYSVDSACASSLSAIHLACSGLLARDFDMAVAGGANVMASPFPFSALSKAGVLSTTGGCKTFRDDADGYCRGDFVGSVVLKRLEDAVAANDNILGVIASSSRNHSGHATSITHSDHHAQAQLFQQVLRKACADASDVSYIEMHGTATQVGDLAEMTAVANTFGRHRKSGQLRVGAVKANIGHSEAAAGVASLIKCILMLQKHSIPPQVGMPHPLNPKFPALPELNIEIPSQQTAFKSSSAGRDASRYILLNNFDASGGNTSLLIEDPPQRKASSGDQDPDPRSCHVITTSAKTVASHTENKRKLLAYLRAHSHTRIEDLAYTTTARRIHYPIRSAYLAATTRELVEKLDDDLGGTASSIGIQGQGAAPPVVLIFTGQGSHYAGMGSELYHTNPTFRKTIDLCEQLCREYQFPSFLEIITDNSVDVSAKDTVQTQLAVVSLEVALAAFWASCGIGPNIVIGHSLGEYAALHVAGVLSLGDMLYLVGQRATLIQERCQAGACAMLAISSSAEDAETYLQTHSGSSCRIACINSLTATVVSGSEHDIKTLQAQISKQNIRSTVLSVPYGFHSPQIDLILDDFAALARGVAFSAPKTPIASPLTGTIVDMPDLIDGTYLARQAREPVNFVGALRSIDAKLKNCLWLEIGPHPVCTTFVCATLSRAPARLVPSLQAGVRDWRTISAALCTAYESQFDVDWPDFHGPYAKHLRLLTLPSYAFDVKDYWITYTAPKEQLNAIVSQASPALPQWALSTCLQHVVQESFGETVAVTFSSRVSEPGLLALIEGHRLLGVPVCPAGVFGDMALTAAKYVFQKTSRGHGLEPLQMALRDCVFDRPLVLNSQDSDQRAIVTAKMPSPRDGVVAIKFVANAGSAQNEIGSCTVSLSSPYNIKSKRNDTSYFVRSRLNDVMQAAKDGRGHRMHPSIFYALFSKTVKYSSTYRCTQEIFISPDFQEAVAEVLLTPSPAGTTFTSSPYWTDSLTHLAGFVLNANPSRSVGSTYMLHGIEAVDQIEPVEAGKLYSTYVRVAKSDKRSSFCDVYVFSGDLLVLRCSCLHFQELANISLERVLGQAVAKEPAILHQEVVQATQTAIPCSNTAGGHKEPVRESKQSGVLDVLLGAIASETGTELSELTDSTILADLGIDSIMAIQIVTAVENGIGVELGASFVHEHPTVADLRRAFEASPLPTPVLAVKNTLLPEERQQPVAATMPPYINGTDKEDLEQTVKTSRYLSGEPGANGPTPAEKPAAEPVEVSLNAPSVSNKDQQAQAMNVNETPTVNVVLMQGRKSSGQVPLFLLPDGSGAAATYIYLPRFKSNLPVYALESPFLQCPAQFTCGIEGIAAKFAQAINKVRPGGPYLIGGYSAGAVMAYETARQLLEAGQTVQGLLLVDMCVPRPMPDLHSSLPTSSLELMVRLSPRTPRNFWLSEAGTKYAQEHMRRIISSLTTYDPKPMPVSARPQRTAIIWARRGLVETASEKTRKLLIQHKINIEPVNNFMEDPSLGPIAWSFPPGKSLGPNGWDRLVGDVKCIAIDGDHFSVIVPPDIENLHRAMVEALVYFTSGA